jgi:hypothetical protein
MPGDAIADDGSDDVTGDGNDDDDDDELAPAPAPAAAAALTSAAMLLCNTRRAADKSLQQVSSNEA